MRYVLVAAADGLGLGVGFAIDELVFENPGQQIELVRKCALIASVVGVLYYTWKKVRAGT